jgi:hypothetical protein
MRAKNLSVLDSTVFMTKKIFTVSIKHMLFLLFFLPLLLLPSCNLKSNLERGRMIREEQSRVAKTQREIRNAQEDQDKQHRKQVAKMKKSQTKETRKKMKELEKKSSRWNDDRKPPFYERWMENWTERRQNKRQDEADQKE